MKNHAYLIMAHNEFRLLDKLISILDNPDADIYVHIDKKAKYSLEQLKETKKSRIYILKRNNVSWGGSSQMFCELELLKSAIKREYKYYHLLSGVDFPLKTQDEIKAFFEKNNNKEFIRFDHAAIERGSHIDRVKYYYLFQNMIGRNSSKIAEIFRRIQNLTIKLQKAVNVDRTKKIPIAIYKGTNWVSITHNLAKYIIEQEKNLHKWFNYTLCVDEIFLHTIAMNSPYKDCIVDNSLRYIDWKRGGPYTFTGDDYDELIQSDCLFARKFSYDKYPEIVDLVEKRLKT